VAVLPDLAVPASAPRLDTGRDPYIDSLRAAALLRVIIYHVYGWVWLPVVFPSMGIMFAMAGSLMAVSLDRAPGWPWGVVWRRLRRLVPPLWLMGALLLPIMFAHGWTHRADDSSAASWPALLLWLVPISDPPGSDWAVDWVTPLWYIRAYLWFVLISPAFVWLFRRWPRQVLALPFLVTGATAVGLVELQGRVGDVWVGLATYGGCWLVGFAHHDGRLRALPWRFVLPVGLGLLTAGLAWALANPDPTGSWNVDGIPPAQMLYSLGAVLLLMRGRPPMGWLRWMPWLAGLVAAINARAVTIYLWNNVAIFVAAPLLNSWSVTAGWTGGASGQLLILIVAVICLIAIIPAAGWVEDVAARRSPRINPWPPRSRPPRDVSRWSARLRAPVVAAVGLALTAVPAAGSVRPDAARRPAPPSPSVSSAFSPSPQPITAPATPLPLVGSAPKLLPAALETVPLPPTLSRRP
jgi:peptidoglycan/LPS O-acetylase OafA/YrhL